MNTEKDKERQRVSLGVTIAFHALFIILCGLGFFSCWEKPGLIDNGGTIGGVSFGDSDIGTGENLTPVDNPALENTEAQSAETTDEADALTDPNSDISLDKVPPKKTTADKKPNNNASHSNNTSSNGSHTMNGKQGHGTGGGPGNQGMSHGQGGTGGSGGLGNEGNGDGLVLAGWGIDKLPQTNKIESSGTALVNFTINRTGKVLSCSVTGPFTESEKQIMKDAFIATIILKKLSSNESNAPYFKGTFKWIFKY